MSLGEVSNPGAGRARLPAIEQLESRRLFAAFVITEGGTYSGNWDNQDPGTPAVIVATTEKVIIENSTITSRYHLIATVVDHSDVTIRNVTGIGLNPNVVGRAPGRFFTTHDFDNVVLERNTLTNTAGIHLLDFAGDTSAGDGVKVIRNTARNIDGRKSDGKNGWLTYNTRYRKTDNLREDGYVFAQFVQLDKVRSVPGVEIAWNEVINEPGNSRVEDNISIFLSSGTKESPIRIHNNYIQGAYTIKPGQDDTSDVTWNYDWGYSGGGIILGDGVSSVPEGDPGFVVAFDNQVVSTTNYGIALAAGHDLEAFDNRILSAGVLPDGTPIAAQNTGMYVWDSYGAGLTRFYNNIAHDNVAGWVVPNGRNDWWATLATIDDIHSRNTHWAGTITRASELAELEKWKAKVDPASGEAPHATLLGTVFNDLSGEGIRDATDGGINNFRVYLDISGDGFWDQNEPIARTTSTGRWTFNVNPGTYVVRLKSTSGWRATKGTFASMKVATDGASMTRTFGVSTTTLVTGMVYMDANVNGTRDGLESGIAGWQVYVDANRNGILDAGEQSVLTNKDGRFALIDLAAGSHQIRVVPSPNYKMTAPGSAYRPVTLAPGQTIEGRTFGLKRLPKK